MCGHGGVTEKRRITLVQLALGVDDMMRNKRCCLVMTHAPQRASAKLLQGTSIRPIVTMMESSIARNERESQVL